MTSSHANVSNPPSFSWSINSAKGSFTGEQKVEIVERMESIANLLCDGDAKLEFTYDVGAVTAKIFPQPSADMRLSARQRAANHATKGFVGMVTSLLLFLNRVGPGGRDKLIDSLAANYLRDDLIAATEKLQTEFIEKLKEVGGLGALDDLPPAPSSK